MRNTLALAHQPIEVRNALIDIDREIRKKVPAARLEIELRNEVSITVKIPRQPRRIYAFSLSPVLNPQNPVTQVTMFVFGQTITPPVNHIRIYTACHFTRFPHDAPALSRFIAKIAPDCFGATGYSYMFVKAPDDIQIDPQAGGYFSARDASYAIPILKPNLEELLEYLHEMYEIMTARNVL